MLKQFDYSFPPHQSQTISLNYGVKDIYITGGGSYNHISIMLGTCVKGYYIHVH